MCFNATTVTEGCRDGCKLSELTPKLITPKIPTKKINKKQINNPSRARAANGGA